MDGKLSDCTEVVNKVAAEASLYAVVNDYLYVYYVGNKSEMPI